MQRVTVKTSTIFIAKGGKTQVYRSVSEVPPRLRKELEESTNSFNSATILIADRRGREEILRALNGLPSGLRTRLASSLAAKPVETPAVRASLLKTQTVAFLRRNWAPCCNCCHRDDPVESGHADFPGLWRDRSAGDSRSGKRLWRDAGTGGRDYRSGNRCGGCRLQPGG